MKTDHVRMHPFRVHRVAADLAKHCPYRLGDRLLQLRIAFAFVSRLLLASAFLFASSAPPTLPAWAPGCIIEIHHFVQRYHTSRD